MTDQATPPKRYTLDEIRTLIKNARRRAAYAAERARRMAMRTEEITRAVKQLGPNAMPDLFRAALLTEVEKMRTEAWDAFSLNPDWALTKLRDVLGDKVKR